jgi:hypothetical protein
MTDFDRVLARVREGLLRDAIRHLRLRQPRRRASVTCRSTASVGPPHLDAQALERLLEAEIVEDAGRSPRAMRLTLSRAAATDARAYGGFSGLLDPGGLLEGPEADQERGQVWAVSS